jgi:hypothetical protein
MAETPNNPKPGVTNRPEPHKRQNNEPAHRQVQNAQDHYFQEVSAAQNATLQRFQSLQTDLERSLERAWLAQDPNAWQTAQGDYQRALQAVCTDTQPVESLNDAFRNYKTAVTKALADANPDDLNFTDLAHLSQSLATVGQFAWMFSQCAPRPGPANGASNGPFQPAGPLSGGGAGPFPPAPGSTSTPK